MVLEGGSSVLERQRGAGRDWSEGKMGGRGDTGANMVLKGEFVRGKVDRVRQVAGKGGHDAV